MIKSEKNEHVVVEERIVYPCLMVSDKGSVVLFIECEKGTLVYPNQLTKRRAGYYSVTWDMERFKLYKGSITLGNEV